MAELLDPGVRPDAVFAFNDLIAIGAMRVLHERGLRVPRGVAVVGFDDLAEGRFGAVTLTTVSPDKQAIANMGVASLLRSLSGREEPVGRELTAKFELVERESTLGAGRRVR